MSGYQETSGMAFDSIQDKISKKQKEVLRSLEAGPKTNEEIAQWLGWPINTVTPRTGELVKKGLVIEHSRKIGKTGRWAIRWSLTGGIL